MADITGTGNPETLDGTEDDDTIKGLGGDDTLNGLGGNDTLDGGAGADSMDGGTGDDWFYVDTAGDLVFEAPFEGSDTVITNVSFTLGAGQEVELLRTWGSATTNAISLTGNELANTILGNAAANVLNGGAGADTLRGYAGNDTYYVDNSSDSVVEAAGGGSDTVITNVSYKLGTGQEVEVLRTYGSATTNPINLTGNAFANTILGNAAANVLDGKGGADMLRGYAGDDTYFVDDGADSVIEAVGGGNDTIITNVSYALDSGMEIEVLRTFGSETFIAIDLTGNEFANAIHGNAHTNVLDGRGGADIMAGYRGNDTYFVDNAGDIVIDSDGDFYLDTVIANVSYALNGEAGVELLRTYDPASTDAINLTGSGYSQKIEGNAGSNVLKGGGGWDELWGFGGEDTFVMYHRLDNDTIADFNAADDMIALDHTGFEGLSPGVLDPNVFRIGTAAADADDRIIYDDVTGRLYWDPDGNGFLYREWFATLTDTPVISANDFVVI